MFVVYAVILPRPTQNHDDAMVSQERRAAIKPDSTTLIILLNYTVLQQVAKGHPPISKGTREGMDGHNFLSCLNNCVVSTVFLVASVQILQGGWVYFYFY